MNYQIEVNIKNAWTPLKKSVAMDLTKAAACDLITALRASPVENTDGLKFRIVPQDIFDIEEL